jgi:hypothetical protein
LPLGEEDPLADTIGDELIGGGSLGDRCREREVLDRLLVLTRAAATNDSKVRALRRLLRRAREPVLVFTEYRDTLAHLAACLSAHRPLLLHGGMSLDERAQAARAFAQQGSLLLATDAASEGLNLHERCRIVVHFELPWTPLRLEQRTGRVDRIGQRRCVHEILLVARHTAERTVVAPLVRRSSRSTSRGDRARLAAVTEATVAALVLGENADASGTPPDPLAPTFDLSVEAAAESERLLQHRTVRRGVLQAPARRRPLVVWRSALPRIGLLVMATCREGDQSLTRQLISLELEIPNAAVPPKAEARAIANEITHRWWGHMRRAVAAWLEGHARDVHARQLRIDAALALRERALSRAALAGARELVQVGLFDVRALAAAEARRRAAAVLEDESASRAAAAETPSPSALDVHLLAIVVGGYLVP